MYTRKMYMDKQCSHNQYYGQFVTNTLRQAVVKIIGKEKIEKSKDPHLNDIPLKLWHGLNNIVKSHCLGAVNKAENNSVCCLSLCDTVCIAKEAARQFKESNCV